MKRAKRKFKKLLKTQNSYFFLFIVFLMATLVLLDWVANKKLQSQNIFPSLIPTAEANLNTPQSFLEKDPWTFFNPTWEPKRDFWMIPSQDLSIYLDDPEMKLEKEFAPTPAMKLRAGFWLNVYGKYSSRFKIVHDRNHLGVIYGVIDFRSLYRQLGPSVMTDGIAARIESKIVKQLKERLQIAMELKKNSQLSTAEIARIRTFISSIGAYTTDETKEILENVRSQTGQKDMFLQALMRSEQLLPHIEAEFRKQNLPVFMARIPFVESSFNPKALSSVGATGIWQFMPETARQMISQEDQKLWSDPIRQTRSAVKLLQIFKALLPDWPTTITAYNSGVGRVRKLVQQYKVKTVDGLLSIPDSSLGFAGQNFYAEVLAANIAEAYKERIFGKAVQFSDKDLSLISRNKIPQEWCDL